jgi:hypothetical protein
MVHSTRNNRHDFFDCKLSKRNGKSFSRNRTHWQLVESGKNTTLPVSFSGHCGAARAIPGKAEAEATKTSIKQAKEAKFFILNGTIKLINSNRYIFFGQTSKLKLIFNENV